MGIFKKFVDLLSDPIEDDEEVSEVVEKEEPVREERKVTPEPTAQRVPEPAPVREEKPTKPNIYDVSKDKDLYTSREEERGLYQSKDTFKFPVFDEEEIETTLSRPRREERREVNTETPRPTRSSVSPINIEKPKGIEKKVEEKPVEKKVFRPSPVISPVYGILDKNYTKDDVVDKKEEIKNAQGTVDLQNTTALSYDLVRRKAYGTLEDELEDTLSSAFKTEEKKETKKEEIKDVQNDIKNLEDPKKHIEKLLDELEKTASMTVGEIEEALKQELDDTDEYDLSDTLIKSLDDSKPKSKVEDELEKTEEFKPKEITKDLEEDDEQLENDLFNLIDSMYEDGDDK